MRFWIELILLGIALGVFQLQHRLKRRMRIEASKLIYWTTLLFISTMFNSILVSIYPEQYYLMGYFNLNTLIVIVVVIVGSVMLQLMAPSTSIQKVIKNLKQKRQEKEAVEGEEVKRIEEKAEEDSDDYVRELHFETFVETVCMLAILSVLILEGCVQLFGSGIADFANLIGLQEISILLMMATVPISIRQIIFYLYSLRRLKDKCHLVDVEVQFHQKLKKNYTKLR